MARFKCAHTPTDSLETTPRVGLKQFEMTIEEDLVTACIFLSIKSAERLHKKLEKFLDKVFNAELEDAERLLQEAAE